VATALFSCLECPREAISNISLCMPTCCCCCRCCCCCSLRIAGDSLFRVVKRLPLPAASDGSQCVEVVNKAAIRVLAWKIWTSNRVVYKIASRQGLPQAAFQLQQCTCSSQKTAVQPGVSSSSSSSRSGAQQSCVCGCHAVDSSSSSMQEVPRTVSFNLLSSVSLMVAAQIQVLDNSCQ
jgi:hypothetical protein